MGTSSVKALLTTVVHIISLFLLNLQCILIGFPLNCMPCNTTGTAPSMYSARLFTSQNNLKITSPSFFVCEMRIIILPCLHKKSVCSSNDILDVKIIWKMKIIIQILLTCWHSLISKGFSSSCSIASKNSPFLLTAWFVIFRDDSWEIHLCTVHLSSWYWHPSIMFCNIKFIKFNVSRYLLVIFSPYWYVCSFFPYIYEWHLLTAAMSQVFLISPSSLLCKSHCQLNLVKHPSNQTIRPVLGHYNSI